MIANMNKPLSPKNPKQSLVYAWDAALALADIHEIDGRGNITSFVHHDFSPKNLLTVGGKLKVSDFNDGQLLWWDYKLNQRCSFKWDGACGNVHEQTHRRSPEECMGDSYQRNTQRKLKSIIWVPYSSCFCWPKVIGHTNLKLIPMVAYISHNP